DPITAEKLRQIDAAEAFVRSLGFRQFRVRHHDRVARLEIAHDELARLWEDGRGEAIVRRLRELGYVYVTLDLAGFQSGSANLLLKRPQRAGGAWPRTTATSWPRGPIRRSRPPSPRPACPTSITRRRGS